MNKAWGLIKLAACIWGVLVLLLAIPVTAGAISADPPSVDFGNVPLNTTATQDIAITVDSGYFVQALYYCLPHPPVPPFSICFDTCDGFTGPGTCNVKANFTPTALGTFSSPRYVYECPTGGGTCIDVRIPLSGRGIISSNFPDLSIWAKTWFNVTITQKEYHFDSQKVEPSPRRQVSSSSPAYLFINGDWYECCPERYGIAGTLYTQNSLGDWDATSGIGLTFDYFAGSDLNFVSSSVSADANLQFEATILFKGTLNRGGDFTNFSTTMKTLGGSFTETASESTERWAGSFILSGRRIDESKVPPELRAPR